jgi:hypothetical protein
MEFGILELAITNLTALLLGVIGKGTIGKWWNKRYADQHAAASDLVSEVRAHGETKSEVASLRIRVEELEKERAEWELEKASMSERISVLERLLLRSMDSPESTPSDG